MKQEMIVAYFEDKAIGWSYVDGEPLFQGDKEWIEHAQKVAFEGKPVSLYHGAVEGIPQVDNPNNIKGVFLALASLPRERIRISKCPRGMMESLGIYIEEIDDNLNEDSIGGEQVILPERDFSRDKFLTDLLDSLTT